MRCLMLINDVGLSGWRGNFLIALNYSFLFFPAAVTTALGRQTTRKGRRLSARYSAGSYYKRHINYQLDHKLAWKLLL